MPRPAERRHARSRIAQPRFDFRVAPTGLLALWLRILVAFALVPAALATASDEPSFACDDKPLVVKIHADWCASCRATQSTWDRVVAELSDQARMVTFDVTDRASYEAAVAEAKRLAISDFLKEYRRRTGAIAVLDCESREPRQILSGERDFSKYREAIDEANPRVVR